MCALLTQILRKAVPSVTISGAHVAYITCNDEYYIRVKPDHASFWWKFQRLHPSWREYATELNGETVLVLMSFSGRNTG